MVFPSVGARSLMSFCISELRLVSTTVVKDYVRIARSRSREVFVPLAHPPGHAQVDFGECIGVIGGVRMKLRVFCFDLPHSDAPQVEEERRSLDGRPYPELRSVGHLNRT
jgi:transposase